MGQLALVVIARDEARHIARCLESARPVVDTMIVLDTGSADATARIAAEHGARVEQFAWTGDFAAARNAALALSGARWNLVLDADEWLAADAGGVRLLAQACAGEPLIGLLPVRLAFDLAGRTLAATTWRARLLPGDVRYAGTVNEAPVSALPRQRIALPIHNDGVRQAGRAARNAQRAQLVAAALAAAPDDAGLLYQAGKLDEARGAYGAAAGHYLRALELAQPGDAWRHDLVVRALFSLKMGKEHALAVQLAELEMANWHDSPDYHFVLGDLLLDLAHCQPERTDELLPMIEASWLTCLELGEQPDMEGAVSGRGGVLAAHNLALLYESRGDAGRAAHYRALAGA